MRVTKTLNEEVVDRFLFQVNVAQDQLPTFLKTAERLKVKGLAEAPQTINQE